MSLQVQGYNRQTPGEFGFWQAFFICTVTRRLRSLQFGEVIATGLSLVLCPLAFAAIRGIGQPAQNQGQPTRDK